MSNTGYRLVLEQKLSKSNVIALVDSHRWFQTDVVVTDKSDMAHGCAIFNGLFGMPFYWNVESSSNPDHAAALDQFETRGLDDLQGLGDEETFAVGQVFQ